MHDVSCCLILMMLLVLLLTSCAIGPSTKGSPLHTPAQRVFLVRHAERFNDSREDPPLTAEGKERAKALADMLRDAGVSAIITSQWIRAKDTAQPLADLLKITPEVIPTVDPPHEYFQATANAVRRIRNDTVLVVGHITIPNIIAELDAPQLPTICESVFSDFFLLVPALGWDGLTRLRYGAAENISSGCRNLPEFLRPDSN